MGGCASKPRGVDIQDEGVVPSKTGPQPVVAPEHAEGAEKQNQTPPADESQSKTEAESKEAAASAEPAAANAVSSQDTGEVNAAEEPKVPVTEAAAPKAKEEEDAATIEKKVVEKVQKQAAVAEPMQQETVVVADKPKEESDAKKDNQSNEPLVTA